MVDAYSRENGASLNPRNFPLRGLYRKGGYAPHTSGDSHIPTHLWTHLPPSV